MRTNSILIVDDDEKLCALLRSYFEEERFVVYIAHDGLEALNILRNQKPQIMLLDLMMPGMDGITATARIREFSNVPIIFLTAKSETEDLVLGLHMGADDYITKPFGTGELLARVRAALRVNRYGGGSLPGGVFSAQGLTINYERRKVFVDGQEVRLTQTEYNIVAFLSEHAGRVMTYAAIVRAIWGDTDASSTKKLQVNMANIRKKLGSRPGSNTYILNELGVGYRMIEEDAKPLEPAEETK